MLVTVDHSEKGKEELETCAKEGSEKLTRWDKFCAFFGIKTSHALKVETRAATVEAMNEKKKEVSKAVAKKYAYKEISPVSLCLAALQQKTDVDLSTIDPKDVLARMDAKGKEAISEQIKKIGEKISSIIEKKIKLLI